MTIMLIHNDIFYRREALLKKVHSLLGKSFSTFEELLQNPDIHYIEQPEHMSVKIDSVKELQAEMHLHPFQEVAQIAIIFHAHMLTNEAQNALLKTLEEQSDTTHWILLVNNEQNVLPTIQSRSSKIYLTNDTNDILTPSDFDGTILDRSLVEQFQLVESLTNQEKEEKGSVILYLHDLSRYMSELLVTEHGDIDIDIKRSLERVDLAKSHVSRNVNKRLALEALFSDLYAIRNNS